MKKFLKNQVLFLFLLFATFTSIRVHADEAITFNTSNYSEENMAITFRDSEIIFSSFPKREEFNYVKISLYGEDGTTYNKQTYSSTSTITYTASGVPDGTYYIQIYKSETRYGTYWSYLYQKKGIKVAIRDGKVAPVQSLVYQNNKAIFDSYATDKATIQFYLQPSYDVQSDNAEIIECAKNIILDTDSDYEKIRKVHDWVANHVWYNYDGYYTREYGETDALGVLHSKKSVCQGYANLTAALLRALKIPTKVISGYALGLSTKGEWSDLLVNSNDTNHAWNEAYVDNRWIIIDTTWDSDNKYSQGQFSQGTGLEGYHYFDPTVEFFSYDHKMFNHSDEVIDYEKNLGYFTLKTKNTTLYYKGTKGSSKHMVIDINYDKLEVWDWDIAYTSSNPAVADVSTEGKVTAKSVGKATITATITIGNMTKNVSMSVTVKDPYIQLTSSVKTIKVGTSKKFKVKLYGLSSVKWTSSNKKIATVSSTGIVTAKSKGTTTITVTSGKVKKSVKVKVVK